MLFYLMYFFYKIQFHELLDDINNSTKDDRQLEKGRRGSVINGKPLPPR